MKKDNAIKKVLERSDTTLPYDFENRTMQRIQKVAERRMNKTFALQIFLVSIVSAALIFGVYYVISIQLEASLKFDKILSVMNEIRSCSFALSIAFLALLLLFLDVYLRRIYKAKNDNSM